ncbi:ATP-binding protein [Actinomadura fibrosa]|uniref:ATP-binding protein n=1 Tax=Actinomadura fibrosa TaxID=111802 RepID=A0ABW2Y047_9ACTN|nr:ATP-binding protein [Actinomadura fibrosa]
MVVGLAAEVPVLLLEPDERAPGCARRFVAGRFRELGVADDYVGRLVVTELVTNSYKHSGTSFIVVRVFRDERDGLVVLEVWDQGDEMPVVQDPGPGAVGGRGLLLMSALVVEWGVRPLNEVGKIVWARCRA